MTHLLVLQEAHRTVRSESLVNGERCRTVRLGECRLYDASHAATQLAAVTFRARAFPGGLEAMHLTQDGVMHRVIDGWYNDLQQMADSLHLKSRAEARGCCA